MGEFLTMTYHINWWLLSVISLFSFICGYVAVKSVKGTMKKVCIGILIFSLFFYSGIGISILRDYELYTMYYVIYFISFTSAIKYFSLARLNFANISGDKLFRFIDKYGLVIIILYVSVSFFDIVYPENRLNNLVHPPIMDRSFVDGRGTGVVSRTTVQTFMLFIRNMIQPFYFFVLYKYKNNIKKLFLSIFLPLYFGFCANSYISRTEIVTYLCIFAAIIYYFNKEKRRIVRLCVIYFAIAGLPFLAVFTQIRNGEGYSGIGQLNMEEAIDALFRIECTFPMWFKSIWVNVSNGTHISEYITYIICLPLPGFLKQPFIGNFQVNFSIAEVLLGVQTKESGFFIPLSGNVCESVFIFGKYLFFVHAIICGYLVNCALNFYQSKEPLKVILIAFAFLSCLSFGRAGTTGGAFYPFLIKSFFYIPIVVSIIKNTKR